MFVEAINVGFSDMVSCYGNEIDKVLQRRSVPGWNYCNFFCIKQGLSFTYQRMGMFEQALAVYQELGTKKSKEYLKKGAFIFLFKKKKKKNLKLPFF